MSPSPRRRSSACRYLLGYRIYDSAHTRFRSPDPTGQEPNPYNYAQGDPINDSDPTGAYSFADLGQDIGGGLAGVDTGIATGAVCAMTAGIGRVVGGIAAWAILGTAGAAGEALIGGGDSAKVRDATTGGAIDGGSGGVAGKGVRRLANR